MISNDLTVVNTEIEILRSRSVLGAVVDNLRLDIYAAPEYFPYIGEALARRKPADERPAIQVDSIELPDSMRGQSLRLVATGGNSYDLFDGDGQLLLKGSVGNATGVSIGGDYLSIFVSRLQGAPGQSFVVGRMPRISSIRALEGRPHRRGAGRLVRHPRASASEGADPERVQQQVNEIANVYVRQNVERKSEEAQKTLEFLD